ncbi:MAG: 3'-5' exonuclease [Synergistaceae bacterium]|nr:3'-5' exonuclease [Synergistaceae bacterium]
MNIAVFDLETNGLQGSSVLSASSIVFDDEGVVLDVFNRFYLPLEPHNSYVTRIHGLTPGRLLALREHIEAPSHFIEDWPDLLNFWAALDVEGVVVHNLSFDTSFLPEIAQSAFLWWCSMKGLTAYCAIPKRFGGVNGPFKWPKLEEAVDVVCDGPNALAPSKATGEAENQVKNGVLHVSLFDCFGLYRVVSRIAKHRGDLLRFAPFITPFRPPKTRDGQASTRQAGPNGKTAPSRDRFIEDALAYECKLRSLIARSGSPDRVPLSG